MSSPSYGADQFDFSSTPDMKLNSGAPSPTTATPAPAPTPPRPQSVAPSVATTAQAASGVTPVSFLPYLKSARFADAVLKIKTSDGKIKTLPVHRIVLSSRSTFFDELFNSTTPSETNSKGLPVYGVPTLPAHRALHEVLGLSLWWVYSMDDTRVALPDNKWDQILGVHHVSTAFRLPRLTAESDRAIRAAIEGCQAPPDDLYRIAEEAKRWGFPDIEQRAMSRLHDLILSPSAQDATLQQTSLETFSTLVVGTDPSRHFYIVRRYIDVHAATKDPVPVDAVSRLWSRVPFDGLELADLESAFGDPNVPNSLVLEAVHPRALNDHSTAGRCSYELFRAVLDHASAQSPPPTAQAFYRVVRAYAAAHPELDEARRDKLWAKVKFVELSVEDLEEAYTSHDVPRAPVVSAMFSRLRSHPMPGGGPGFPGGPQSDGKPGFGGPSAASPSPDYAAQGLAGQVIAQKIGGGYDGGEVGASGRPARDVKKPGYV